MINRSTLGPEKESLAEFTRGERKSPVINWYRTKLSKEDVKSLHEKSDFKGALQSLGYLGVLMATAGAATYSFYHGAWWVTLGLVFLHGTVVAFVPNAVHELGHGTVFQNKSLNVVFCRIFAFFGWLNFELFQTSHTRHHRFTLHPPDDLEVVLPQRETIRQYILTQFINPRAAVDTLLRTIRIARGQFEGEWEQTLYPAATPETHLPPVRWARTLLIGHALILVVSLALGCWIVPILVSGAPFFGTWLFFLCNQTQHIGLQDEVPDFRLCCRTFTLNPLVRFLYWHMNFHTEHHMYAAVPCYHLGRLHEAIKHDLPPCAHGIIAVWKQIAEILRKQEIDSSYKYCPVLPNHSRVPAEDPLSA